MSHVTRQMQDQPLDTLLADYARGALSAPLHALVASHLVLKPESRPFVTTLEAARAAEIEKIEPARIRDRDAKLAAIFGGGEEPARVSRPAGDAIVPDPLARYLAGSRLARPRIDDVPWKALIPGVKEYRVADNEDGEATLYWIRGGRKIPSHTHDGSEYTLVLKGAFSDINGRYARGDIAIADMDVDHQPVADPGEDCFCFAVTDAPLRLTGPIGRIVQKLFRH